MIYYAYDINNDVMVFAPSSKHLDPESGFDNVQEIQNTAQLIHWMKFLMDWPVDVTPENDEETRDLYDALDEIWKWVEDDRHTIKFEYIAGSSIIDLYEFEV